MIRRPESLFGSELRYWRERRGLSQLRLAAEAGMSPRYVSFIETGRSRPGPAVIERLADALDVPLRDRNRMLVAAGLPARHRETPLGDEELSPFRRMIELLLARHEPYPAFVFDHQHRLVQSNEAAKRLFPGADGHGWIDLSFAPGSPLREATENFAEVAWSTLDLMRREAGHLTPGSHPAIEKLERCLEGVPRPALHDDQRVLCPRIRFGDRVVKTFSTVARFGAARDVTLQELRVELVFPADAESAAFFESLAG